MSEEINGRSEGQGIQIRVSGKASENEEKIATSKLFPTGNSMCEDPMRHSKEVKKMSKLDRERSEDGHKMGL